jgi:hypothetical protein
VADNWIVPSRVLTGKAGQNRFIWDLRYGDPGPQVLPGTYQVRLTAGDRSYTQPIKVIADPRSSATPLELQKQFELSMSIFRDMGRASEAIAESARLRRTLAGRRQAAESSGDSALTARITAIDSEAVRIAGAGGGGRGGRGGGVAAGSGPTLNSVHALLVTALEVAGSADRTPPATAYQIAQQASHELDALLARWKTLREEKAKGLN